MTNEMQVDAWGAMVPGRGDLVESLKKGVVEEVKKRQIPNLEIQDGLLNLTSSMIDQLMKVEEPKEYIFFSQKMSGSGQADLALRIAKHGALDLVISWRLLESNPAKEIVHGMSQGALITLGVCLILAGLITLMFGFGLLGVIAGVYLTGLGLGWWRRTRNESPLTSEQKLEARQLAQTVDYCLMRQLEQLGISREELRITQAAQMEGIGRL